MEERYEMGFLRGLKMALMHMEVLQLFDLTDEERLSRAYYYISVLHNDPGFIANPLRPQDESLRS